MMSTRVLKAQDEKITDEMVEVAKSEGICEKFLKDSIAKGHIVILKNKIRKDIPPVAIGNGLRTKVCASICVNSCENSLSCELDKLRVAQEAGVDCVFDISASSYIKEARQALLLNSKVPLGTNPFLELGYNALADEFGLINISTKAMLDVVENHCKEGVDFVSLNCGLTKSLVMQFLAQGRLSKITSQGAQILFDWIEKTELENPYYRYFDELLEILKKYDVTLHLASAFKTGSISDSFDSLQIAEYAIIGELARRANKAGVQVMSDGFGHVSINKIPSLVNLIKEITLKVPLFVSSAFACDCAVGHDNISSSIANSIAATNGANLLNVVSGVDYLKPSSSAQLREGVISSKISAHCADIANNNSDIIKQNYKLSFARTNENWNNIVKNSIDKTVFDGIKVNNL
ncbi:MAG: phosphomethylpyrimidine synthase ThiC [Candidatus Gastranaerophilales bacterium]|nr:phosphomethylpyrimidine synthase ThiC [Candidatus Gastranaerophilales bacterium]